MRKLSAVLCSLVLGAAAAAACAAPAEGDDARYMTQNASERHQAKVLKVGCEAAFAPFTYTSQDGKLIGFDLDLIRAMGESQGYEVVIQAFPFDGLIPALITNNIDLIISGFTISPERAKKVDFSDPYYRCGLTFLIKKEDAGKYNTLSDLKNDTLCVQIGTTGALYVSKQLPDTQLKQFNSPPETYLELINGGCKAVINDRPVNDFFLASSHNKDIVSKNITTDTSEYYGIAVNKGNKEMLDLVNKALKDVQDNGEFKRISDQWFGYDVSAELREEKAAAAK